MSQAPAAEETPSATGNKRERGSSKVEGVSKISLKLGQVIHPHHRDHKTSIFLPRPWKKHKHDIVQQRIKKLQNLDDTLKKAEYSERDERLKTVPFGCLSFHILELKNVSASVSDYEASAPLFYYCTLTIGGIRRVTKYVQSATPRRVRFDAVTLFSCELSEWRDNYRNKMKIELWTFQDPNSHFIVGVVQLHLYTFVHHIHGIESSYIWGDGILRGKIIYEYTFSYGALGYGHSTQFRNTDVPILESVSHSMFPRIMLEGEDIAEERFHTILPSRIKLMTINSFVLEKTQRGSKGATKQEEATPQPITMKQVEFEGGCPTHCKVHIPIHQNELTADFCEAYGDFLCLAKRSDRVDFCRRLVDGRRQDKREDDFATELFNSVPKDQIETIIEEPSHPSEMTGERPCGVGHRAVVYEEDEPLLKMFPSTDRSSGYIGRLFGFGDHEPGDVRPDFPLEEMQVKRKQHKPQLTLSLWARYLWSRCGAALSWMKQQIVPDQTNTTEIPEISVTLPSPEISTTDLCALWVDANPPRGPLNEEQILRQEAHKFNLPPEDEPPERPGVRATADAPPDPAVEKKVHEKGDHTGERDAKDVKDGLAPKKPNKNIDNNVKADV